MSDKITEYGFIFGAIEVQRAAQLPDGSVCVRIIGAGNEAIDVYSSPAGRSLRAFKAGKGEMRAAPVSSEGSTEQ